MLAQAGKAHCVIFRLQLTLAQVGRAQCVIFWLQLEGLGNPPLFFLPCWDSRDHFASCPATAWEGSGESLCLIIAVEDRWSIAAKVRLSVTDASQVRLSVTDASQSSRILDHLLMDERISLWALLQLWTTTNMGL